MRNTMKAVRSLGARKWCVGLAGLLLAAGLSAESRAGFVPTREVTSEDGHQYVLVGSRVSWGAAQVAAEQRDGYLATITSPREQKVIERLFREASAPSGAYWFGVRKADGGEFENVTGERLRYTHWLDGQPDNLGGNETRGSILWTIGSRQTARRRGFWNDLPDGKGYPQLAGSSPDLVVRGFVIEIGAPGSDGDDGSGGSTGTPGGSGNTPGSGNTGGDTPTDGTPGTGTPGGVTPGTATPGDGTTGGDTPGGDTPGSGTPGSGTPGDGTGTPPDGGSTGTPPGDGGPGTTPGGGDTGGGPVTAVPLPTALYLFPSGLVVAAYAARRMRRRP